MLKTLAYGVLFFSLHAACAGIANAQEFRDVPVALDFTPLGESAVVAGTHAAPADVSFGRYPLSVLGIENAIRRADARVDAYAQGVERSDVGPIAYAVVAIRDWERRYPADPWIAKELLSLSRFYAHVGTAESRELSARATAWLEHDYPHSEYARAAGTPPAAVAATAARAETPVRHPAAAPPSRPERPAGWPSYALAPGEEPPAH